VRVVRFRPRPISEETGTDEAVVLTCKCRSKFRPGRWSRGLYASERGLTLIYIYTTIHMDRVERQLGSLCAEIWLPARTGVVSICVTHIFDLHSRAPIS